MRATFTQENVDAMKEFDLELARRHRLLTTISCPSTLFKWIQSNRICHVCWRRRSSWRVP